MSYITGYIYSIGLVTANITLGYTAADFIIYIANVLNVIQITSQGATVGLYCPIVITTTSYSLLGMKFSAYLNKFLDIYFSLLYYLLVSSSLIKSHKTISILGRYWYNNYYLCYTCYGTNAQFHKVGIH